MTKANSKKINNSEQILRVDTNQKELGEKSSIQKKIDLDTSIKLLLEENTSPKTFGEIYKVILENEKLKTDNKQKRIIEEAYFELNSFVVNIDIRSSTKLMMNSLRHPKRYVDFISDLSKEFKNKIISLHGIFDKFTGDGVLCHFPIFDEKDNEKQNIETLRKINDFFIYCNRIFFEKYADGQKDQPPLFIVDFKEVGIGIGCDYGKVSYQIRKRIFYAVGAPVVYACRLSSAPANNIYLNRGAYLEFQKAKIPFAKKSIPIKNERDIYIHYKDNLYDIQEQNIQDNPKRN